MKVLFVCRGNIGRSQTAMEYFKRFYPNSNTDSAGTEAVTDKEVGDWPGAAGIIEALKEDGIDITHNQPKQLTEKMLDDFDKVIVMATPDQSPEWLKLHSKYVYWEVPDLARATAEDARITRDFIKSKVKKLA